MGHQAVTSSDLKTSSAAIVAMPALLYGVQIIPAAADTTIIVYDNASAGSGTVLFKHFIPVSTSASSQAIIFNHPIIANNGLYLSISGTSAGAVVLYGNI